MKNTHCITGTKCWNWLTLSMLLLYIIMSLLSGDVMKKGLMILLRI